MEQARLVYMAGDNVNPFGNRFDIVKKFKTSLILVATVFLGIYPRETHVYVHQDM